MNAGGATIRLGRKPCPGALTLEPGKPDSGATSNALYSGKPRLEFVAKPCKERISTLPPKRRSGQKERTASRPRLAARPTAEPPENWIERPTALVAAAKSSVRSAMFIALRTTYSAKLRRS